MYVLAAEQSAKFQSDIDWNINFMTSWYHITKYLRGIFNHDITMTS